MPTVPRLQDDVLAATANWAVQPRVVDDAAEKWAAFRIARAALAKSGTVTLELALAGVPMVAAYKVSLFEELIARMAIKVPSVILANLVLGENVVPELLQRDCTPEKLADALAPLLTDSPERRRQIEASRGSTRSWKSAAHRPAGGPPRSFLPARKIRRAAPASVPALFRPSRVATCGAISAARSADSPAAWRRYRAGAGGRSSGPDPRSFPSTGRSSRRCARPRTAP